jgi:hypothetical protein
MIQNNKDNFGGMKDAKDDKKFCISPYHNAPTHICIPYGKVYEHECPSCGKRITISGSNISYCY